MSSTPDGGVIEIAAGTYLETFEFENCTAEDLVQIITRMVTAGDYLIDDSANPLLLEHFDRISREPNFGNARDARRLFEGIRKMQSQRLRGLGHLPDTTQLRMLTAEDVAAGVG